MPKFRKKPVIINAEQYHADADESPAGVCESCLAVGSTRTVQPHVHTMHQDQLVVLEDGDWIVPEPDGEHYYPIKNSEMPNLYDLVDDEPIDLTGDPEILSEGTHPVDPRTVEAQPLAKTFSLAAQEELKEALDHELKVEIAVRVQYESFLMCCVNSGEQTSMSFEDFRLKQHHTVSAKFPMPADHIELNVTVTQEGDEFKGDPEDIASVEVAEDFHLDQVSAVTEEQLVDKSCRIKKIEQRVIDIVSEQLDLNRDQVQLESRLVEDFGADSLDQSELVMQIEDDFDIEISEDAEYSIRTVQQLVDGVVKKVAGKKVQ